MATEEYPEDDGEFRIAWATCTGKAVAMREAVEEVENRASQAYLARKDELAGALRELASKLGEKRTEYARKLDGYIQEGCRRRNESVNRSMA